MVDEIHSVIIFEGHRHIPFVALSKEYAERCVICTAPNKTFNIAGLQGAQIIIPNARIREKYQEYLERFAMAGPTPMTMAAARVAYKEGGPWYKELMNYLQGNVKTLTDSVGERLPAVKVIPPEGTYMAWLDFRGTGLTMDEINHKLIHEAKVALNDGYMFGESGAGFQRLNFACPRSILQEAIDRIVDTFG